MFPVARIVPPSVRTLSFQLTIELVALLQKCDVLTPMTLTRGDILQGAVLVLFVVPAHETLDPLACFNQAGKALRRPHRAIFDGTE